MGQAVVAPVLQGLPVPQALSDAPDAPVCFVPQSDLPACTAYEQHIFDTHRVPTRENLHDFFNGLVWLHYPHTKRRMNALQAQAIAAHGVGAVRGPLRDALTVFDENGAVLHAPPPLWQALLARDWHRLFIDLRPLWSQSRLVLIGHALLEKLVHPRKNIVAHVYCPAGVEQGLCTDMPWLGHEKDGHCHAQRDAMDAWLAAQICPERWPAKPFAPLPVLGVPQWWKANEAPQFYADTQVFRPARAGVSSPQNPPPSV